MTVDGGLEPIGPGRWQSPDGRLFLQAYDVSGQPEYDPETGLPVVEPSTTGLGVAAAERQIAGHQPEYPRTQPRRRWWQRRKPDADAEA